MCYALDMLCEAKISSCASNISTKQNYPKKRFIYSFSGSFVLIHWYAAYIVVRNTDGGQDFSFLKTKQKYLESENPDMAEISSMLKAVFTSRSAAWLMRSCCRYLMGVV